MKRKERACHAEQTGPCLCYPGGPWCCRPQRFAPLGALPSTRSTDCRTGRGEPPGRPGAETRDECELEGVRLSRSAGSQRKVGRIVEIEGCVGELMGEWVCASVTEVVR